MIQAALDRAGGNISETARSLGLTRRGLYLKLDGSGWTRGRKWIPTRAAPSGY